MMDIDRLPPHSLYDEVATLGCQLIDPSLCIPEVFTATKGSSAVFYDLRHQTIQDSIFKMSATGIPVDVITLVTHLKDCRQLEQVGGIAYIASLESDALASNLSAYLDTLLKKHLLRQMIHICTEAVGRVYDYEGDADELCEQFEREVMALRTTRGESNVKPIREIVKDALTDIESMFERKGKISGLSTGLSDLDMETDGLHGGEYILIAAFPSVGKTSLAMNIVEHVALDLKLPVGVFSAEMSARSLVKRSISSLGRVNLREIREGRMAENDFPKIMHASGRIAASNLVIDDTSDLTVQQMRAKARRMVQQHGIKLFVADYAQLFSSPGAENRTNELDQVSKGFKNMAKELNVPVIVLSQLTEDAKGNVHLKGARALGEDADGYWQLKRPKNSVDDPNSPTEPIELWLRKQRNEARNVKIDLTFMKTFTRFELACKIDDDDVPDNRAPNPHND